MTHLSEDRVKDLFRDIEGRIKRGNPNPIRYLKNLHPSKDEIEGLEWRYRLSGYLEGLAVSDQMDNGFIEPLVATLFSRADVSDGDRPGRARPFSIDIVTEQRKTFSFDVPAMNPLDAYVQLTKRTAYKSIPGIEVIKVFEGLLPDRTSGVQPYRVPKACSLRAPNMLCRWPGFGIVEPENGLARSAGPSPMTRLVFCLSRRA